MPLNDHFLCLAYLTTSDLSIIEPIYSRALQRHENFEIGLDYYPMFSAIVVVLQVRKIIKCSTIFFLRKTRTLRGIPGVMMLLRQLSVKNKLEHTKL